MDAMTARPVGTVRYAFERATNLAREMGWEKALAFAFATAAKDRRAENLDTRGSAHGEPKR